MKKIICFTILLSSSAVSAANFLNLEAGLLNNPYNQVRIPGAGGTQFNLANSFEGSEAYFRLSYKRHLGDRHGLRLLYAPLRLTGTFQNNAPLFFNGHTFGSGPVDTQYKFNSYRASYYYRFRDDDKWKLYAGVTGKIRDAEIRLTQDISRRRGDLGFVPLLYLWSEWKFAERLRIVFDFDGLAAPQGRAFDVALAVGYALAPSSHINLGFRMLEGGADNDKVYNFAQLNYLFLSYDLMF
jgi:hypothetical protein